MRAFQRNCLGRYPIRSCTMKDSSVPISILLRLVHSSLICVRLKRNFLAIRRFALVGNRISDRVAGDSEEAICRPSNLQDRRERVRLREGRSPHSMHLSVLYVT